MGVERSNPAGKIMNMNVAAFGGKFVECHIEVEKVFLVEAARALAAPDVHCKLLGVLRTYELLVVGRADIDESVDLR